MAKELSSNPFIDVSVYLFFEDIADKQGVEGFTNYMIGQAKSLARSVPTEVYDTWEEFVEAAKNGDSVFSSFEKVDHPQGNCFVTKECPFTVGIKEYIKRLGDFSKVHMDATKHYNNTVQPSAAFSKCILHQTYRQEVANRITIEGKPLRYAQIATKGYTGDVVTPPSNWERVLLEKGGITQTEAYMLLRANDCLYLLYVDNMDFKK